LIEKICVENLDPDEVKAKEIMTRCKEANSAHHIPHVEKESVNSPSMPKSRIKNEMVGVKAKKAKCLASNVVVNT
jgi:hypothetical protein